MKRIVNIGFALMLLWTLVPGVAEFTENFAHVIAQGHMAHASPDGDTHAPKGLEHGCTETLHVCVCCVGLSCLPGQLATLTPYQPYLPLARHHQLRLPLAASDGIDRPPRA